MLRAQQSVSPCVYCCAMSNGQEMAREGAVIRSVDRAVAILDLLAQEGWRTGAEDARELGVHRSTALRLLATLDRHGLVERDPRTPKYRRGRRLAAPPRRGRRARHSRTRPAPGCTPRAPLSVAR